MIVWTTLVAWEDGEVDGAFEVVEGLLPGFDVRAADTLTEEDHGAAGTA